MRINGLLAEWQKEVSGESSNNPLRVVELLGGNPFFTKSDRAKMRVAHSKDENECRAPLQVVVSI
jgi:hypothetical protein